MSAQKIKISSERNFGVVFSIFFALLAVIPWIKHGHFRTWPLPISGAFLVIALIYPKILAVPNRLWAKLGMLLQKIVSPVMMGIIFFLIMTPFGVALRLLGRDLLKLKKNNTETYWIRREPPGPAPDTMKFQF